MTVEHFQQPRNVGRMADADLVGRVDDPGTETTITLFLKLSGERIERASFRTLGCSACVAASSMATELLAGRSVGEASRLTAAELEQALGGLPPDKRYCAELAAEAARRALSAAD